tara:strand:+ start:1213 stop:2562 length:1350 start_codon:yes stop_codon:yes gene_type:complete
MAGFIKNLKEFNNKLKSTKNLLQKADSVEEQTISEIVLASAGINIPLPTQDMVIEFYKEIEEPNNILTTIPPDDWTNLQYLEYQSDVRKYRARVKFQGIKDAVKLKKKKNEEKTEKQEKKFIRDFINSITNDSIEGIRNNRIEESKPQGVQKLGTLLSNISKVLIQTNFPTLLNMVRQVGLDTFETRKQQALEELGIKETIDELTNLTDQKSIEELKQKLCPTPDVLESLIQQRNGIINFLNSSQQKINSLKETASITGEIADGLITTATTIELSAFIANQLAKVAGLAVILAPLRSVITDLQVISNAIQFTSLKEPRIPPLLGAVNNFSTPLNQVNSVITSIVRILSQFDQIIAFCSPNATLENLSVDVLTTVAVDIFNEENGDGMYKGFRLEIEEKPYTDTVSQNRAIGLNQSGVVLIATNYSFASDTNVLINELKFIIDRDNLKAY